MKKLNFDTVFKSIIMVTLGYSLILLIVIAYNSGIGRYQDNGSLKIIDTKTGKIYRYNYGKVIEYEKLNEK